MRAIGVAKAASWSKRFAAGACGLLSSAALAQSSSDYATMARIAWSAFECTSLASVAGIEGEESRLFKYGYEQGKRYLEALGANKIKREDVLNIVPSGFTFVSSGPTADFVLGRVFEGAQENALKGVFADDGKMHSKEFQRDIARVRYDKANCSLIGRRP